jgi:hypothetical protein
LSAPGGSIWPSLRAAAEAFCPPFEIAQETPGRLMLELRALDSGDQLRLRYRSERGLFLRTYYLVIEADLPGEGPAEAGELVLSRRKLRWKRPRPQGGEPWSGVFASPEVKAALKRVQVERLGLSWEPRQASWRLWLESLIGSVTVTFFPPLETPNPLKREDAQAVEALVRAVRRAQVSNTGLSAKYTSR